MGLRPSIQILNRVFDSSNNRLLVGNTESVHRQNPFYANDFFANSNFAPYLGSAISSGTLGTPAGTAEHPGVIRLQSSATPNSGYTIASHANSIMIAGDEKYNAVFSLVTLSGSTYRLGFLDTASSSDATDGVYLEIDSSGVATGKTSTNGSRTPTDTTATLSASTWYRLSIELNSSATLATYTIKTDNGSTVWTNTVSATIPTSTGRECGAGVVATNSGSSPTTLIDMDYMSISFSTLSRG